MTWIKTIGYKEAGLKLKKIYDRVKGPGGNIDNILMAHSLRPHTLAGHMALYKNVLHHTDNSLPKWFLETIGVYVSHLNKCDYCVRHHFEGLKRLLDDDKRSQEIWDAIHSDDLDDIKHLLGEPYNSAISYAYSLTLRCGDFKEFKKIEIEMLQEYFNDGEILEINQVVSYFNYANRTVLGLGVNTDGDILGLSPNDSSDPDNWSHR